VASLSSLQRFWALGSAAFAQQYPAKQVRVIVPFAAGGTPDVVARIIGQQLVAQTGQAFVIENRPGADGIVGAQVVAEAPADGSMLLVTSSSFVINPSFHKTLPFDVVRDFEPVTNISATEAFILGVNPKLPAQSVPELIGLARKPDNRLSFASPGVGNVLHLAAELFKARTGVTMVHVPYRGAAPAITGLIAGDVQVMFLTPPSSLAHIESGKIRALAYTHHKRAPFLPDVPTMAEVGVPNMDVVGSWTDVRAGEDAARDPRAAARGGGEGAGAPGRARAHDRAWPGPGWQLAGRIQAVCGCAGEEHRRDRALGRHRAALMSSPQSSRP
jgi:tripartite-type tricarboxylate transporter receptor subunit TctC